MNVHSAPLHTTKAYNDQRLSVSKNKIIQWQTCLHMPRLHPFSRLTSFQSVLHTKCIQQHDFKRLAWLRVKHVYGIFEVFIFLKIYTYTNRKMYGLIFTVLFYWKYLENEQINDIYWPVLSLDSYFTKRRKSCRFGTTWVWAKNISFWILPLNIIFLNNVNLLKQEKQFSTEHFCFTWSLSITLSFLHSDVLFKYLRQFQWLEMEPKYYIVNKMNNKHI